MEADLPRWNWEYNQALPNQWLVCCVNGYPGSERVVGRR